MRFVFATFAVEQNQIFLPPQYTKYRPPSVFFKSGKISVIFLSHSKKVLEMALHFSGKCGTMFFDYKTGRERKDALRSYDRKAVMIGLEKS